MNPEIGGRESRLSADDWSTSLASVWDSSLVHEFSERLDMFKDWPSSDVVPAVDLALGAFSYTGKEDKVKCLFCQTVFNNWNHEDLPYDEHQRLVPQCPFVIANFCRSDRSTLISRHTVRLLQP